MVSPFAVYGKDFFFSVENRVNGLWNTILAQRYPQGFAEGHCLISPDTYPRAEDRDSKCRTDLLDDGNQALPRLRGQNVRQQRGIRRDR